MMPILALQGNLEEDAAMKSNRMCRSHEIVAQNSMVFFFFGKTIRCFECGWCTNERYL